jgi:hypothetical protein
MSTGHIQITRQMLDHPIVGIGNPLRFSAWCWMIAEARFKAGDREIGGKVVTLKRGQFAHSLRFMASATGMTLKQLRGFFAVLEREQMVTKTGTPGGKAQSIVTICNYDEYQAGEDYTKPKRAHQGHTKGTPRAHQGHKLEEGNKGRREEEPPKPPKGQDVLDALCLVVSEPTASAFIQHRRELKKPLTLTGAKAMATKLKDSPDPDSVMNTSIANGWQGVFPERQAKPTHQGARRESAEVQAYKLLGIAPPKSRSRERLDA